MRASLAPCPLRAIPTSARPNSAPNHSDRRASQRHEAALTAEVVVAGSMHQALIRNISTGGLTLAFAKMPTLFKGALLLVRAPGLAPITGVVRWMLEKECGLAFNHALAEDVLNNQLVLFDPGKRARPARARIKLPAIARSLVFERKVMIENIGSGGAQISSGLRLPLPIGRGVMLEVEGLLPIGGYVRWCSQGRCGLMFSKLLPVAAAQVIAERCSVHHSWLNEVKSAHAALTNADD